MDNQHRLIRGYRDLSEDEVAVINNLKSIGDHLGTIVAEMQEEPSADQRWVAIGKTHLQQGVMALVRAVARPDGF